MRRIEWALQRLKAMARPKHRTVPGGTYFVTTNTWERRALFVKANWAEVVEAKLFEYRDKDEYLVHRYVIMPDHLHVILTPGPSTTLERAAQLIKGGSSHEIGERFATRFPVWQPGFVQHLIRGQADYDSHARYVDMNPIKRGLASRPEEYSFCSASGKYRLDAWPVASGAKAP
jgi:putative transposase